jgi:hypothetical protein
VIVAGFASATRVRLDGEPLVLTSVPPSRIVVGEQAPEPPGLPRRLASRAPRVTDAVRRARAAAGAASRG